MNPFKWNTAYLYFFSLRQFPFIFFFFQGKKCFIKARGQNLWVESPFIFYYCFCFTSAFSSETPALSLLFILNFPVSIFSFILTHSFHLCPLHSGKASQVNPMIHQLDFIYFIVSALNHCHCEYIIVFDFLPFFFILFVFLFIPFCCLLGTLSFLIEALSCILSNFIFFFFYLPGKKYFQKYILSLSFQDVIPFSCLAVFPHRPYDIYCLSSWNEARSISAQFAKWC